MKILTHDTVIVIAGKDKGKKGKVLRAFPTAAKVVVEKVNVVTKHVKKQGDKPGERIKFEKPVDVSNVALVCPNCGKPTRVGYTQLKTGKKSRVCKKCNEGIQNPNATKN